MKYFKFAPGSCPVCSFKTAADNFKFIENYSENGKEWTLYQCENCSVQLWIPFKEADDSYYNQFTEEGKHFSLPWNYRQFFDILPCRGGKVIDIGCDNGDFLSMCKNIGYSVYGLEISRLGAQKTKDKGIDCFIGYLSDFVVSSEKHEQGYFDLVTFFEVLEHLSDPGRFLKDVHSILKPDGKVAFSVPFRERAEIFKMSDHPPGHLTRWNVNSLSNILKSHGFDPEVIKVRPLSFQYVVGHFYQADKFNGMNKFIKFAMAGFMGLLFWLPMKIAGGKGNRVFIMARKAA